MSNELPGKWGELLAPKGIHSYRDMAAVTGVGHETLRRLVTGGATSSGTVKAVAEKIFGGDRNVVWELRGAGLRDHGDWRMPDEWSLLTREQQKAVADLVAAMVPSEEKKVMGNAEHPAPIDPLFIREALDSLEAVRPLKGELRMFRSILRQGDERVRAFLVTVDGAGAVEALLAALATTINGYAQAGTLAAWDDPEDRPNDPEE